MPAPTVPVTVKLFGPSGGVAAGVTVRAKLDRHEVYQGFIVSEEVSGVTGDDGLAVLNLFPNAPAPVGLGTLGSVYRVTAQIPGARSLDVKAQVPNAACTLDASVISDEPVPALGPAEAAVLQAQGAAGQAGAHAAAAEGFATAAGASATEAGAHKDAALTAQGQSEAARDTAQEHANTAGNQAAAATEAKNQTIAAQDGVEQAVADANTARAGAESARDAAQGHASSAGGSAAAANDAKTAAQGFAQDAGGQAGAAAASANAAGISAGAAETSRVGAVTQRTAAEAARDQADQFRQLTQAAAALGAGYLNQLLVQFASATALSLAMGTVQAQEQSARAKAAEAASYAASAASVAQQDLSGVTAALHRSPNAVTALFVYDTSKDSDGGAWIDRVADKSWMTEPLNGTWLPSPGNNGFQNEFDARLSGATMGAELIANGDFSAGLTGWTPTAGATLAVVDGRLKITRLNAPADRARQDVATTAGRLYVLSFTGQNDGVTWPTATIAGSTLYNGPGPGLLAPTTLRIPFVASGASTAIEFSVGNGTNNVSAFVDNVSVREVTAFTTASGAYYQLATDGKFYRLWKNILANPSMTGGVDGTAAGTATAPAGWSFGTGPGGTLAFSASARYPGSFQCRYIGAAQRPYMAQVIAGLTAGATLVGSCYIEALASGAPTIRDVFLASYSAAATVTYRKNGATVADTTAIAAGDFIEAIVATIAAGNATFRHGLGAVGNATGDVTLSPMQVEYVVNAASLATAFEAKTGTATSQSEVFRGNKAKFPRVAAIVTEAANVTIYDLTEPGRPMWMRFATGNNGGIGAASTVGSLAALNGKIVVGKTTAGAHVLDFAADAITRYLGGSAERFRGTIAQRGNDLGATPFSSVSVSTNNVNAVAMTVLPDAPLDPVTQLPVPTVGVAVGTGNAGQVGTVLMNDGTAVNYSQGGTDGSAVFFNKRGEVCWSMTNASSVVAMPLATSNTTVIGGPGARTYSTSTIPASGPQSAKRFQPAGNVVVNWGSIGLEPNRLDMFRENPSTPATGLLARITGTYNTGWMTGDIRRAVMADVDVGTIGDEKIANANWALGQPTSGTVTNSGGVVRINSADGSYAAVTQPGNVAGRTYQYTVVVTAAVSGSINVTFSSNSGTVSPNIGSVGTHTGFITCNSSVGQFEVKRTAACDISFSSLSIKEVAADRSVKAKNPNTFGTLAKSAVAAGAQLVCYGGFSAVNYLQETYSADLDYGTGGGTASAWVAFTTAAAGTILDRSAAAGAYWTLAVDATGKFVATVNDGTTTRTATSTASYNDGTPHKVRMDFTTTALTLKVDGKTVATTTGAAMLTLNNAAAVFTVGNNRALTSAFPGSITLVKTGATIPFAEQAEWMYAQERAMFQPGAQVTLPDTGNVVSMDYDSVMDRLKVATAANECSFLGLVRVQTLPSAAGSIIRVNLTSGVKLTARSTTNPGVDVSFASQNLREELLRRAEDARMQARLTRRINFDFTTGQVDAVMPVGWEIQGLTAAGVEKREGATKDFTRLFDGFKETARFGVAPSNGTWVQAEIRRAA